MTLNRCMYKEFSYKTFFLIGPLLSCKNRFALTIRMMMFTQIWTNLTIPEILTGFDCVEFCICLPLSEYLAINPEEYRHSWLKGGFQ